MKCECGCGQTTPLATKTNSKAGRVAGQHTRFLRGHRARKLRFRTQDGYVRTLAVGHPRANPNGMTLEHLLVAERALGKSLPDGAQVHHVNGDRSDNRPANLVVCQDAAYHKLLHRRQRALKACGNANWHKCRYCKEWGPGVRRSSCEGYHLKCKRRANRARRMMPGNPAR